MNSKLYMKTENSTDEKNSPSNPSQGVPQRTKNSAPFVIIALAIVAFAVGFLLVHLTLPEQHKKNSLQTDCTPPQNELSPKKQTAAAQDESIPATPTEMPKFTNESGGLPEVPPAPTPNGVRLEGAPLYFKCWADKNDSAGSKECDRLRILEKRMATRLYVIHDCKMSLSNESEFGLLSLGANLDFTDNSIKFWSGPSSTVANASKIGNCIRQKLAGLPLHSVSHKFEKYRIFFTVDFFDSKQRERVLAQKRKKGRRVKVIMDKVNVREQPVDGASIGRISSNSEVTLLKKNKEGDWCHVLTSSNKEGWMICSSLKL